MSDIPELELHPELSAFLPMLYVAWSDGELGAHEVEAIRAEVSARAGLRPASRAFLERWLDPDREPAPHELHALLTRVRDEARGLSRPEALDLVELGRALAAARGDAPNDAELQALRELGRATGLIASRDGTRRLLVRERPEEEAEAPPAPSFEPAALQALLDGRRAPLRQRLRELLSQPRFARVRGLTSAAYREQVLSWLRILADEGIGALAYPEELGGGGDLEGFLTAFETLACHDLSLLVKFGVQFGLFGVSVLRLGTERHHRAVLPGAGSLEIPGCFAMTETDHGSNVQELETTARFDPERGAFILDTPHPGARKDYIGNAACHGRQAVVFAQLTTADEDHGVHAFLVPIRDDQGRALPGVAIEDCGEKLGLNGVDNGRLSFQDVLVPRENLLDRFAAVTEDGAYESPIASAGRRFFTMLGTLVGGRVSIGLAALSATKSALAVALRYAGRRRQFGPPGLPELSLLDYPSHRRRLLPRLARTYALHFALQALARSYLSADDEALRDVEAGAAGLKALATWHATDTIQECREACGGQGYLAENRFAELKADTDVFTTFEGDNTVLLQLVVKAQLSGYARRLGGLDFFGLIRHLGGLAATTITELNPIVTRLTDPEHLRGRDFQLSALRWRETQNLAILARRLKSRLDRGQEAFQALVACQDHALEVARAHVERQLLEAFHEAVDAVEDAALRPVLEKLAALHGLATIEADRGWFLERGYLEGTKSRALCRQVEALCLELNPDAAALVDAFGIPDALLGAPIARG